MLLGAATVQQLGASFQSVAPARPRSDANHLGKHHETCDGAPIFMPFQPTVCTPRCSVETSPEPPPSLIITSTNRDPPEPSPASAHPRVPSWKAKPKLPQAVLPHHRRHRAALAPDSPSLGTHARTRIPSCYMVDPSEKWATRNFVSLMAAQNWPSNRPKLHIFPIERGDTEGLSVLGNRSS